jgi:hypothetical protein
MAYRLTRRLPDGTVKAYSRQFKTKREAARMVAYALADNGAANRKDAASFASQLQDAAVGATLDHPSGYAFTIEMTSDA